MNNIFSFKGRMRRSHYWLLQILLFIINGVISSLMLENPAFGLGSIVIAWVSIAIGVQRMHDVDKSGWFL